MARSPDPRQRTEGFRKAEASLRLEGMDPAGTPLYENIKERVISGDITYEQGRAEIWLITRSVRTATDTDRKLGTIASSKNRRGLSPARLFLYLLSVCYFLLLVCYLFATCLLPLPSAVKRVRHVSDVYIAAPQGFPFRIPFITAC